MTVIFVCYSFILVALVSFFALAFIDFLKDDTRESGGYVVGCAAPGTVMPEFDDDIDESLYPFDPPPEDVELPS